MKIAPRIDRAVSAAEIINGLGSLPDLRTATVRAFRREISHHLRDRPPEDIVALALRLLRQSDITSRFVAYEIIRHHPRTLASLRARDLEQLGAGIDSWGAVDIFACYLAGRAWRARQVPDRLIHQWARSPDRWWRRAALVSTVPLNNKTQGGSGDAKRTLAVCRLLVHDTDDMVVKAMSWALRELAKRDPQSVRAFLAEHESSLAKRVLREVRNKLTSGLKNPRRR
jgi:3-methyladenine DNA glycosylase AlkD